MEPTRIGVLITCHNRKDITLACLQSFFEQVSGNELDARVYVVDAGSTDGTVESIREQFPEVNLIVRDEGFFWCGGMFLAFEEAMKEDHDYYLWLNDDTKLLPGALRTLMETAYEIRERKGNDCIVVGSIRDPETGFRTYGGMVQSSKWRTLDFHPVEPSEEPQPCDTMNGNCVLIPRKIAHSVGNLSPEFTHAIGDIDYGLRARAQDFSIWVAPGYAGVCGRNPRPRWMDANVPLRERLKILHTPKGLPPQEWVTFTRRHTGMCWPLYWLKLEMRVLFPKLWEWLGK